MREIATSILLVSGSLLILLAAVGLVRLPDVLCRSHAVAKASCLGLLLILASAGFAFEGGNVTMRLAITAGFLFLTIPLSAHLFGRLALRKGIPRWKERPVASIADEPSTLGGGDRD